LWPQYRGKVFTISQPAFFWEMVLMLCLVVKGAKPQTMVEADPASHWVFREGSEKVNRLLPDCASSGI
jgi:hypothetical protein